jgi:ribosomal protein L11 methylase PrmA
MPRLATLLKPGGVLLMSGFLQNDLGPIEESVVNHKMMIDNTLERNNWILAVVKKESY